MKDTGKELRIRSHVVYGGDNTPSALARTGLALAGRPKPGKVFAFM